jgi:hypothetical protein
MGKSNTKKRACGFCPSCPGLVKKMGKSNHVKMCRKIKIMYAITGLGFRV